MRLNLLAIIAVFLLTAFSAQAATVTYRFDGVVTRVDDFYNYVDFSVGSTFSGKLSFDTESIVETSSRSWATDYGNFSGNLAVDFSGLSVNTSLDHGQVVNYVDDGLGIQGYTTINTDPEINLMSFFAHFELFSRDSSLFDSGAWPDVLKFEDYDSRGLALELFPQAGGWVTIDSELTSLERVSVVPVPAGIVLLLAGLGFLGFTGRRRCH